MSAGAIGQLLASPADLIKVSSCVWFTGYLKVDQVRTGCVELLFNVRPDIEFNIYDWHGYLANSTWELALFKVKQIQKKKLCPSF